MRTIRWLKAGYFGMDYGTIYPVQREWNDRLFIIDEFGRSQMFHTCYTGILFEEVSHAS